MGSGDLDVCMSACPETEHAVHTYGIYRDAIQALADSFTKSVIVVDTSNEIAGEAF